VTEGCETPHDTLNVLDIPDLTHFCNGRYLVEVFLNVVLGDYVPYELALRDPEGAFLWV
jgi:hypothetical protein